jgi:hypothetical protein
VADLVHKSSFDHISLFLPRTLKNIQFLFAQRLKIVGKIILISLEFVSVPRSTAVCEEERIVQDRNGLYKLVSGISHSCYKTWNSRL